MRKKYILTFIIFMQVLMILIVVSYAWFHPDTVNKTIKGNNLSITASEDLILKYKGVTYTSLRLNDIYSNGFTFEQVSSTGLAEDNFYKIDYGPRLSALPAQYVEATANTDYIEFTVTLQSSSKGKRIYLDGPNSGFSFAEKQGDALYGNNEAADCMRMSLTYYDDNANLRSVVFSNNRVKTYVVVDDDFYYRDANGNKVYNNGEPYIEDYAETVSGYEEIGITGKQNTCLFSDYDIVSNKDGLILFDLNPRQSKDITVRIWLDGTCVNQVGATDNITGRPVSISLHFTSSFDQVAYYNSVIVEQGDVINTINNLAENPNDFVNNYSIEATHNAFALRTGNYEYNDDGDIVLNLQDNTTRIYYKEIINTKTYFKAASGDPLYYDVTNQLAYVKYSDLTWKLNNDVSAIKFSGITSYYVNPNNSSQYILGEINDDNEIIVHYGDEGDMFNLVGCFTSTNNLQVTVINEAYIFGPTIESYELTDKRIPFLTGEYTDNTVSKYNTTGGSYYTIEDGEYKLYSFNNTDNFVWIVKNYSINGVSMSSIINNCTLIDGIYYLNKDGNNYSDIVVNASALVNNATFILAGCHVDSNGVLHEVVTQLYYVYSN